MSTFGGTTLNAGSGGPTLATSTDTGGKLMPFTAVSYLVSGNLNDGTAVFQEVDATHGLPVQIVAALPAGTNVIGHVVVDSIGSTVNIAAASLPLPTGAATAAKQPALGTAGTASADVISVQGIAGMTALKVDGSGVTQPVSLAGDQAVNVAQVNGTTASVNTGNADNGTQRVVLASNQPAVNVTETNLDGSIVAWAGTTAPTKGLGILGKTNDGTPQYQPIPEGPGGRTVIVEGYAGGVEIPTNETKVGGNAIATGNGTTSAGTQRVTISSDSTGQVALAAGSQVALAAGSQVALAAGSALVGQVQITDGSGHTMPTGDAAGRTIHTTIDNASIAVTIAATQAVNAAQIAGTTTSVNEGSSDAGTMRVALGTDDNFSTDSRWSSADDNAHNVKASAGRVFRVEVTNAGAGAAYLKLYNKASAPNPASDTPVRRYIIPGNAAGAGAVIEFLKGRYFSTGIAYVLSGAAGDADTTAVALNQCAINVDFK